MLLLLLPLLLLQNYSKDDLRFHSLNEDSVDDLVLDYDRSQGVVRSLFVPRTPLAAHRHPAHHSPHTAHHSPHPAHHSPHTAPCRPATTIAAAAIAAAAAAATTA